MKLYIDKICHYGIYSYPYYLYLRNYQVYDIKEVLSKYRFQTQKDVEQSDRFVRFFYVDYNTLVKNFIKEYNDDDLTEASKTWIDEEMFDTEFRRYIDGTYFSKDWHEYKLNKLREAAIVWCEKNNIKYSKKQLKWG